MVDLNLLSPWVRRFLMEYLIGERNLAPNTQKSYRDTLRTVWKYSIFQASEYAHSCPNSKRNGSAVRRREISGSPEYTLWRAS